LGAMGLVSVCEEGVEADDLIATLTTRARQAGVDVVIASSDKDFMQLVESRVGLLNPNDKKECIWTDAEVRTRTGVSPGQIVDWLSLIGDSVDNIPGVQGVGPKTATELLQQFGTIDSLYARIEQVESPRLRAKLAESQDVVRRNQELIRLRTDLAGDFELESFRAAQPDVPRLLGLFSGWGFRTLREELEKAQTVQHELF